jgi:hypothetical protein
MQKYLYNFHEMFSVLGHGTPENPGGDFSLYCWIEAPDENSALQWGHSLLGDYYRQRFARTDDADSFDGAPIRKGEIERDPETIARLTSKYTFPSCDIGEIPTWREPWRISNLDQIEKSE